MTDAEAIAMRLRRTRLALGYETHADFIRSLPITYNTYSGRESGQERRRLTLEGALVLCSPYDLSLDWLYFGRLGNVRASLADKLREATP